ncbi:MAG TPA: FADH(2)-oxidizing methylenetetrahydrofolate--tRNA-(uracil(54)-C(5))-methyltransferase TrmFO [Thermoflexia bacterium]|jgi:methylenetetrahydrofolate--tRNA-(uracil-5-)-methyltransferase|nr:FADH(2)-oxidizing methylenetetrahydrofolate--tRNA-(uracil(54)-C(5))-methyltransferase TrmFO [Thermoflexia bacterium]
MAMRLVVVGGGLAGSEAAWQAAERGVEVILYEMRPRRMTPAHVSGRLAELVCSNSLGSDLPDRAPGLLKAELRRLGSLILDCADVTRVPAGSALAVDRERFAEEVTRRIEAHPRIQVIREEVTEIPDGPTVIATGPLTSEPLAQAIAELTGEEYLYFYDAMAPIVAADSIDMSIAFRASRYGKGGADYINCPMTEEEYDRFVEALVTAERIPLRDFEREDPRFFEGCLPIEVLAARGRDALAYGPLRPVGLIDPRTGKRPYAVVQLRQDDLAGTLYNMVGFQTNLRYGEQERVFRMIPGLEEAEFVRYGQMHRNTFLNAPRLLEPTMAFRGRPGLFFAGQITGVEGYVGSVGSGWVAGVNAARFVLGQEPLVLPRTTMLGALCYYVSHADPATFQPMKANFGLLPPLSPSVRDKRRRYRAYMERALTDLESVLAAQP